MADSYYTVIKGKKYDRRMIELAEGLTKGRGDGRISINDAKNLLRVVKDANNYSATEKQTTEYIRKNYKFTKEGDEFFRSEIRKWAATKRKKAPAAKGSKSIPRAESKSSQPLAVAAPAPHAAAVAEMPQGAPSAKSSGSVVKQILLGLILIIAIAAIFYFIVYKSSCARPAPTAPATPAAATVPAPTDAPKVQAAPPANSAPVPEKTKSNTPLAAPSADLKTYIEKTRLGFVAEKTALTATSEKALDELAQRLKSSSARLQITGHTCSLGPKSLNQIISDKRARIVKDALVSRGVPAERIETQGVADSQPVGNNKTVEGRVANRRVAFKILN